MPAQPLFETVAIVGVGLIGGSLARAARRKNLFGTVLGLGRGMPNLQRALELGVIDAIEDRLEDAASRSDLVVLATPVCALPDLLARVARCRKPGSVVTDVGSVKGPLVAASRALYQRPSPFVPGHPVAGTEHSGVEASFASLFESRTCILTPTEDTDPAALEAVRTLWESVGSRVVLMKPDRHDLVMGYISHLPHMVAYGLVHTIQKAERDGIQLSAFSAGGFRDFTRIASSDPEMWRDICLLNRDPILESLEALQDSLREIVELIARGDGQGLTEIFLQSRLTRAKVLNIETQQENRNSPGLQGRGPKD